jgi:hypothetical protein
VEFDAVVFNDDANVCLTNRAVDNGALVPEFADGADGNANVVIKDISYMCALYCML